MQKEISVMPDQVNEHGQITDEKLLKKNRNVFTFGTISSLAVSLSVGNGIPTKIIKVLGGSDQHIGLLGSIPGLSGVFQFLGALVLRKTRSDKRGLRLLLLVVSILSFLTAGALFSSYLLVSKSTILYAFLALIIAAGVLVGGVQNIESSWVGDLVPRDRLGWFNSIKFMGVNIFAMVFGILIGKWADVFPTPAGYGAIYGFLAAAFFAGILIYWLGTDREPRNLNFFSAGASHHERLNYGSFALWCYIAFYGLWACGRSILGAFTATFLLEEFHFSLAKLAWFGSMTLLIGVLTLYVFGKITDKRGNRKLLILVSGFIALCMFLWVGSAWWGLPAIIVFSILNGASGQAHTMLGVNLGLEIFPDKGRAAYLAFSRFFIGAFGFLGPIIAGWVLHLYGNTQIVLFGKTLTKYYLTFGTSAAITLCCIIPLILMGNRKVD